MEIKKSKLTNYADITFYLNDNGKYVVSVCQDDIIVYEEFFDDEIKAEKNYTSCLAKVRK